MTSRLASSPIPSFRCDGTLMDLAAPDAAEINFSEIAQRLSVIPRFAGSRIGPVFSVAQHCVMGTEAMLNEGASNRTAALFLLHDAHEGLLGDITVPMRNLIAATIRDLDPRMTGEAFELALDTIKDRWDHVIYTAAGLPVPSAWTNSQRALVREMDTRMAAAEARALCGPRAVEIYPVDRYPKPKFRGDLKLIKPWGPMKAEEAFIETFKRLIGEDRFFEAAACNAAHRGTLELKL
ncbi:hypothetical protein ACIQUB_06080 [Rhizobium sp. NPDC090275]|uniref:hypothetical protein n=1 Tax=Rhizobium sp. NPDC090275 TaxID=3364498 RepID=UPI00383BE7D7